MAMIGLFLIVFFEQGLNRLFMKVATPHRLRRQDNIAKHLAQWSAKPLADGDAESAFGLGINGGRD